MTYFFLPYLFLLGAQAGSTNVGAPQLDVEHPLHLGENGLVGRGSTTLVRGDSCGCLSDLLAQSSLGHGRLEFLSALLNGLSDFLSDSLGLDDVVGAVDLGEALTLSTAGLKEFAVSFPFIDS